MDDLTLGLSSLKVIPNQFALVFTTSTSIRFSLNSSLIATGIRNSALIGSLYLRSSRNFVNLSFNIGKIAGVKPIIFIEAILSGESIRLLPRLSRPVIASFSYFISNVSSIDISIPESSHLQIPLVTLPLLLKVLLRVYPARQNFGFFKLSMELDKKIWDFM